MRYALLCVICMCAVSIGANLGEAESREPFFDGMFLASVLTMAVRDYRKEAK